MNLEKLILSNLVFNEEYMRKTVPFLKDEYFKDNSEKVIYKLIEKYVSDYNNSPSLESLAIELSKTSMNEQLFTDSKQVLTELAVPNNDINWLLDQTESFCQEKAVYNAIMESIQIIDDKSGKLSKGAIPQILSDALAVSFDTAIGHDFVEDAQSRFEFYQKKEVRKPFDLAYFNKITHGGLPKKTLNVALAGTGVGKSLFMCHCAAGDLINGSNVLYITLEMAEERIAERIDANLLDIPLDELQTIPEEMYKRKMEKLKKKVKGKLIIKEYPTAGAGSANFRHLLNELKLKKDFKPDVIYVDYLNICMSSRVKQGPSINSYTLVKAIAEELRGLAVEFSVPIVTATQTTRSGFSNSDVELTDTSESFGLPATADFMFALISTEELQDLGQIMVKQLKNRYSDLSHNRRFVLGIDRAKMRLYDVEQSAQDDIMDGPKSHNSDKSVFDNSKFGDEEFHRSKPKKFFDKNLFKDFK